MIGTHGTGNTNENGERLLTLCATHTLSITNTQFRLCEIDIATWTHPRSGHHHLIDYVIVRQRDMQEVRVTRVMRGAECGTDHKLIRSKLHIRLHRSLYCRSLAKSRKLNVRRLEDPVKIVAFRECNLTNYV